MISEGKGRGLRKIRVQMFDVQEDWRVIAQWQIIRNAEKAAKAAKGEQTEAWAEDKGYLPSRVRRNN